ncbi:ntg2p [Saccharomyces arboricola H-6]|uniref:Endonuclease III homolog n=1 Tax=Saccharomyces arboricola (strain H-6 / AS 2.3317 / CBS 10644) TaxID=1160507 RepID=J8PZE2_SACAR|nr:ntg2p [Saccharomyces arboricola H-6]
MGEISQHRKRKHIPVDVEEIEVRSKYFKKENDTTIRSSQEVKVTRDIQSDYRVNIEWIKALKPIEYFEWIDSRTCDDPKTWGRAITKEEMVNDSGTEIPATFLPIYNRVRLMRSKVSTPVDAMGCSMIPVLVSNKCGIPNEKVNPKNFRLQFLIGTMLSAQTRDERMAQAALNITGYCLETLKIPEGITLDGLLKIEESKLADLIRCVSFYTRKASFIKRTAQLLVANFDSDIPYDIEGLLSLPGVGPKMGYLTLQKGWGLIAGICVDVHVHRLCSMWNWVDAVKCKTAEHTRKELQTWLPHSLWYEINTVLVGFGQLICMARSKRCDLCLVNNICNARNLKLIKSSKFHQLKNENDTEKVYSHWLETLEDGITTQRHKKK